MRSIKCVPKIILRFSALPAGNYNGSFNNLGSNANFWTATENNSSNAYNRNFNTGASMNLVILSVPEGSDKPLKYPLMFEKSNLVLINKIDTIDYFDFDFDVVEKFIYKRNPLAKIFKISAKVGTGIDEVANELSNLIDQWRK